MEACRDTKRALGYCKKALEEINAEEPAGDLWERRWSSLIALLRTACEVLKREAPLYWHRHMEKPNTHIKGGRNSKNDWRPEIFGKFIWTDANLFLHEGKVTTGQSRIVFLQGAAAQAYAAGEELKPVPPSPPPRPPLTSYHVNTGRYKGQDPRDLAAQAISWLEQQIVIAET